MDANRRGVFKFAHVSGQTIIAIKITDSLDAEHAAHIHSILLIESKANRIDNEVRIELHLLPGNPDGVRGLLLEADPVSLRAGPRGSGEWGSYRKP